MRSVLNAHLRPASSICGDSRSHTVSPTVRTTKYGHHLASGQDIIEYTVLTVGWGDIARPVKDMHQNERLTDEVRPVCSRLPAPVCVSHGAVGFAFEANRFSMTGFATIASDEISNHCHFRPDEHIVDKECAIQ